MTHAERVLALIIEVMRADGWPPAPVEISRALGISSRHLANTLDTLIDRGQITKRGRGCYWPVTVARCPTYGRGLTDD